MANDDDLKRDLDCNPEGASPEDCEADANECQFRAGDLEQEPGDHSVMLFADEIHEAFPNEPIPVLISAADGLPEFVDLHVSVAIAPPLTYDTVVCVEDDRRWVGLYWDEMPLLLSDRLFFLQQPRYCSNDGTVTPRAVFPVDRVKQMFGMSVVEIQAEEAESFYRAGAVARPLRGARPSAAKPLVCVVRPIRPVCKHYKRQIMSLTGAPDRQYIARLCEARKSVGGASMSLRDEAVYACEYRDPPDPASVEKHIGERDRKILRERPDLTLAPLFGMPGDVVRLEEKKPCP